MTLYGEFDNRFRAKPSALAIVSVTLFASACGALLATALLSSVRTLATRSVNAEFPLVFYAPLADNPFAGLYPLSSDQVLEPVAWAVGVSIAFALALVVLYPSSQTLASRLALHSLVTMILAFAGFAPLADLSLLSAIRVGTDLSPSMALGILVAGVVAVAVLIAFIERRVIRILGNVFSTDSPGARLRIWLLRIPIPCLVLGLLSWLNGWIGGAAACAAVIGATFFENISQIPKKQFEELREPLMREAAATWPFAAAILLGTGIWLFGLEAASLPRRAIVVDKGNPVLRARDSVAAENRKELEPKIEIHRSRVKK